MRLPLFLILVGALPLASLGCNTAQLSNAPDASPNCGAPELEFPCKGQATTAGCPADLGTAAVFGRDIVIEAGSFPPGCTVLVSDPVPDIQDQCSQLGSCNCGQLDGGAYAWACVQ